VRHPATSPKPQVEQPLCTKANQATTVCVNMVLEDGKPLFAGRQIMLT
jgi:hypothetical protein